MCPCYAANLVPPSGSAGWVVSGAILGVFMLASIGLYISHRRGDTRAAMHAAHVWGLIRDGCAFAFSRGRGHVPADSFGRRRHQQAAGSAPAAVAGAAASPDGGGARRQANCGQASLLHHAASAGNASKLRTLLLASREAAAAGGGPSATAHPILRGGGLDAGDHRRYTPFTVACAGGPALPTGP
eukprot:COSAG01_NODE_17736_length_1127_cov_1.811284_2_plen_185_part_00